MDTNDREIERKKSYIRLDWTDIDRANWNVDADFVVVGGVDVLVYAATATTTLHIVFASSCLR